MTQGQSWKIVGKISKMELDEYRGTHYLHGTIQWTVDKNGSNQYRKFKCRGKVAKDLFDVYKSPKKVKLTGFQDTEIISDKYYPIMVVEKFELEDN